MNILDKSYKANIDELKNKVITGQTESISWRIKQINKISKLLDENKKEIIKALFLDLGKSEIEALSEILLYNVFLSFKILLFCCQKRIKSFKA